MCLLVFFFWIFPHYVCEEEESGSEEEILQYYTPAELGYRNRRKKRSKIQPKNSQSLFSIVLSVNHGLLALQTHLKVLHQYREDRALILTHYIVMALCNICQCFQQDDNSVLQKKHGEFWMEVKNGTLFGVTQHEGYKDQHYVCFHTSQACLYHHGKQEKSFAFFYLFSVKLYNGL